ncbi:MAG TPA: 4-alpha-glucanotransferase [Ferruginibacter sp.]|nr:4-alpha-glucanotransferase [Ferruginibacter sp.]
MTLHFYLRFHTKTGQNLLVSGDCDSLGNNDISKALPLQYLNDDYWVGQVELNGKDLSNQAINYQYVLQAEEDTVIEWGNDRRIDLQIIAIVAKEITLIDTWNNAGDPENIFFTKPFKEVFFRSIPKFTADDFAPYSHHFKVKAPLLKENEIVCLLGNNDNLNNWNTDVPILLTRSGDWWSAKVAITNEDFPISYKYGVYDIRQGSFVAYEIGENRLLLGNSTKENITIIHDGFIHAGKPDWKGAGVAIPVFSLRTEKGLGTGEFADINLLVDWAKNSGLKLIQLLPVNDTTSTYTWRDSYPYSAISAFALHPLYLNLDKVASPENKYVIDQLTEEKEALNKKSALDYDEVIRLKFAAIRKLFTLEKSVLVYDAEYYKFFQENSSWLIPYAAFSYLRDVYDTADFTKWKSHGEYSKELVDELVAPTHKQYDSIAVHYFTQYHLHKQLKAAAAYAHENGIMVKGDLPIGICRNSVDAWMAPEQYNMDQQAGAPPDDFAIKGQNWGFPTYNWTKMQADGFAWWQQRFQQMSEYFDGFRIDHILGFFRIWSIPLDAVEGILGRFVPAIPVARSEFENKHISFITDRFCKPFITNVILQNMFGDQADYIKNTFLRTVAGDIYELKPEFNTQRKVEAYFSTQDKNEHNKFLTIGLYDLISNVILFQEEENADHFHFRINMEHTSSFHNLNAYTQNVLKELYTDYFYIRQDEMWKKEAMKKLPALKRSTNMLVFGEDLGMVPHCVPEVMKELGILSLEIQRMPKQPIINASVNAPYLSVVTPSTHDMSTIRGYWYENKEQTQHFYNNIIGQYGKAPEACTVGISKEIIFQHLHSPAMWSIFQLQDLLGISETLRQDDVNIERINIPENPTHYWRYRMHLSLEELIKHKDFSEELKSYITSSGR